MQLRQQKREPGQQHRIVRCMDLYQRISLDGHIVGSMEAPANVFLLFFLFSDWLDPNHLKSRIKCGFLDICSSRICSLLTEKARVTNYQKKLWHEKNVQKTKFEAAEMILHPWNQQIIDST